MEKRIAEITRKTMETNISVKLNLDGSGAAKLDYPIGFMAHMLNAFTRHGLFDMELQATGDLEVDQHHLVEDTGITLGQSFARALGEKRGIHRQGSCLFPMDEALARAVIDISGRSFFVFEGRLSGIPLVSGTASFQTDTIEDFWQAFTSAAGISLHLDILRGRSDHHKIEAMFKAVSLAMRDAVAIERRASDTIPSTKGTLI
ncbi:MAG: imidazoleglycerol-phosphate dehydratase HisB [Treponema sp.]|jgi:imidazoleglycerol-phosphate dehydratase|nr:imidazoleglycerol-phosphate dehydratase HisB [Treponema sp.]